MSKGFISPHGLKYTISDEIAERVNKEHSSIFEMLITKAGIIIEHAELLSSFVSFIVFCVLSFLEISPYYMIPVYSLIAYFVADFFSNILFLSNNPISRILLSLYQIITKFFLHYLIAILISIFIVKNWLTALIYIVGSFILSLLLTSISGSYLQREHFNNKVLLNLLRKVS